MSNQDVVLAEVGNDNPQIKRKPRVPATRFVKMVIDGIRQGKTNAEVAEDLGMDKDSFNQRMTIERRKIKEKHGDKAARNFRLDRSERESSKEVEAAYDEAADFLKNLGK